MPIPTEWEIERARKEVLQRIESVKTAKNDDYLTTIFFRLSGYLEAMEDQELLSEDECEALSDEASKAFHQRATEIRPPKKQISDLE